MNSTALYIKNKCADATSDQSPSGEEVIALPNISQACALLLALFTSEKQLPSETLAIHRQRQLLKRTLL